MKRLLSILILIISILNISVKAEDVSFTASAPKVVAVGEQFQIIYTLNKKGSNLRVPAFKGFNLLYGPSTSSSSSVQIINGHMTQEVNYSYTYVLQASAEGKYEIAPATIKIGRKEYKSNSLSIDVVKGNKPAAKKQSSNQTRTATKGGQISSDNLFVKVLVDKTSLYQGEYLIATIKVYTQVDLAGFDDIKFPSYNGFWTQDIKTPSQISLQRENYNGQIYNVGLFKKTLLYPQRSGKIVIEPFELECKVRQVVRRRSRSIFDDFFGSYQNVTKKIKSNAITINVKNLPGNKPVSFNGAVGNFNFTATLDNNNVKTNEAITLKVKISGTGNLKLINPLKIDFPPDFEAYDPKISSSIKNTANGSVGNKSFEYLIIPRYAGKYRIAPISFSYFDSKTKRYKTFTTNEFIINVTKGSEEDNVNVVSGFTKEDVKYIGTDIRYLKTNQVVLKVSGTFLYGTLKFYLFYIISFIVFIIITIVWREQIKKNANIMRLKNKRAGKVSRKRLKEARGYLKKNNSEKFYDEILNAIWGYLADKLSIPLANLSRDTALSNEKVKKLNKELLENLNEIIDTCEMARYAPSAIQLSMDEIYKKTSKVINKIDQKIK